MIVDIKKSNVPIPTKIGEAPLNTWFYEEEYNRYGIVTRRGTETYILWMWNPIVCPNGELVMTGETLIQSGYKNVKVTLMPPGFTISLTNR